MEKPRDLSYPGFFHEISRFQNAFIVISKIDLKLSLQIINKGIIIYKSVFTASILVKNEHFRIAVYIHEPEVTTARLDGGGSERATIVCGFLGLDARPFNPLLAALPRVLHLPGRVLGADSWVTTFLRMAAAESNLKRPGGEAVVERMSEMLFVEVLRRYVDSLPADQTGWLAGMRDPVVGRALSLLHQRPADGWTLEQLGREAGVSRSSLHERFVHFIGQPPMQYLTNWRMQLAACRLRDTEAKVVDVALDVGYESEAAFSRAFKRVVGVAPGTWRRERRTGAGT